MANDDRLQRLLDIEAIKQLKARYFRTLDTKDWDAFKALFTQDAVMEVPDSDVVEHGPDAIVTAVSSLVERVRTIHHGHMPEIELTGPNTAWGIWAMFDYVEWPRSDAGDRVGLVGYGHYVEQYVRSEDEWRIARVRLERLRVDPLS